MSDPPRFPINVRINGIMYKDKYKMYMTSVLWSDQSELTVCRSLQDFREFHKRLKKIFPAENPRERVIPRFGGRMIKMNFQRKTPARCVHRVRTLEKYCEELLRCDPSISGAADVIQFFLPRERELHPEFMQNSVIIFQPEDVSNELTNRPILSAGNVTQPYVTKTYRCVAPYETKDTKNRPFNIAVNETLEVLIKDQAGWWLVENEEKCLAWFPAPFLEMCEEEDEEDEEDDKMNTATVESSLHCAVRSYTAKTRDELSVTIGTIVEVLQKSDTGWWFARYSGKTGYVPSMYLQPYTNPLFSLQKKFYSSTLNQPPRTTILQDMQPGECLPRLKRHHCTNPGEWAPKAQPDRTTSRTGSVSSSSDGTDFSFQSSSSLGLSLSGFEDEEDPAKQETDSEPDSVDTTDGDLSGEEPSPTSSEGSRLPRVPPRPHTEEILSRCTTYTRNAAMATQSRLFPERFGPKNTRDKPAGRY